MAVQLVGAIIGRSNKCGGIPKYERRYEIYEYIICMYRQHTNINSESKVKPKEKRIVICILQRFYRI